MDHQSTGEQLHNLGELSMDYKSIGEQIRKHRKGLKLSQEEVGEMVEVSTSFIGHIERGTRKASLETVVKISRALHVSIDTLIPPPLVGLMKRGYTPDELKKAWKLLELVMRLVETEINAVEP